MSRHRILTPSAIVCAAALMFVAVNCLLSIQRTTITSDEVMHIPAGYYSLADGEFRMNAEHPPLAKMWSALPLMYFLPHDEGPGNVSGNFSQRGAQFLGRFWTLNRDEFFRISFWARSTMVAFTVGLGILIYLATRRWFGTTAAILAILLFSLEPNILGHGRLVHTDIPAAFMYLLFFITLDGYWRSPSIVHAALLGLVTAMALVTKFSMIVLVPVLAAVFLFLLWRARRSPVERNNCFVRPILASLVFLLTVQAAYGFRNPTLGDDGVWIQKNARHPALVLRTIETLSYVLPRDFLFGIYVVETHNNGGHSSSVLGRYGFRGWWSYFPVAFALKTPIPFLLLSVAGVVWALWRIRQREYAVLLAVIPLVIYMALAMSSGINIGVRHMLPAFPLLFMLGGALLATIHKHVPRAGVILAASVIGIMGIEAFMTFPNYLSYMNQFKGTNPGWHYLSDSNVEWGDAVQELAAYLKEQGETQISGALLGGNMTLQFYGIEFRDLYGKPPETRYVALGGSFLNGSTVEYGDLASGRGTESERVNFFDAYRNLKPVAIFGDSIYLFENPMLRTAKPPRVP